MSAGRPAEFASEYANPSATDTANRGATASEAGRAPPSRSRHDEHERPGYGVGIRRARHPEESL